MNFSFKSFVDGSFDYDRVTKTHSCIWLREEKMDIGGGKITTADIDRLKEFPDAEVVTISGLQQDTFEYFIKTYGNQLKAIRFFKNKFIEDLSLLGTLPQLEYVYFFANQRITSLWDMSGNTSLSGLAIKDFSRYWQLRLPQTDVLFRIISGGKKVLINEEKLTMPMEGLRKGGYNVAEVFGKNYLFFVSEAKKNGYVSNKIYRREKRKILKNKIIPLYFDFNGDYEFDNQATGYFSFLMPFYKFDFYFYFYFLKVVGKYIKFRIKQIL